MGQRAALLVDEHGEQTVPLPENTWDQGSFCYNCVGG